MMLNTSKKMERNQSSTRNSSPCATSSTINPIWTTQELKPGVLRDNSATAKMNYCLIQWN